MRIQRRNGLAKLHFLLNQRATIRRFLFRHDDYSCGYAIARLQVQQADTLRSAAGFADGVRVHANDFAVLADQHDLGGFVYLRDAYDFTVTFRGLDVDDARTAAPLQTIFFGGSALAIAVFGDGENERTLLADVDYFGSGSRRGSRPRPTAVLLPLVASAPGFGVVAMPTR